MDRDDLIRRLFAVEMMAEMLSREVEALANAAEGQGLSIVGHEFMLSVGHIETTRDRASRYVEALS
jgi:hypothetical protein